MSKVKEVNQALREYGVKVDTLKKLDMKSAIELLSYKRAKLKEFAEDYDYVIGSEIERSEINATWNNANVNAISSNRSTFLPALSFKKNSG